MDMNMNRSWLAVANNALARINQPLLETLEQPDTSAILCRQLLPLAVGEILDTRPWRTARKRALIPALAEAPAFGFSYAFPLPSDFIRIVELPDLENDEWELEGSTILADVDALKIIYIATPEETKGLSPFLISAITTRLASKLVLSLTSDSSLYNAMYQESMNAIQLAITQEDAGKKDEMYETNSWRSVF